MASHNRPTITERLKLPIINPAYRELGCSYVYLITCGEFTKIGLAVNPERRFATLQSARPYEMRLAKVWHTLTPAIDEECLHAQFESCRVRGEWFKLSPAQLTYLVTLNDLSIYRE